MVLMTAGRRQCALWGRLRFAVIFLCSLRVAWYALKASREESAMNNDREHVVPRRRAGGMVAAVAGLAVAAASLAAAIPELGAQEASTRLTTASR